MDGWQGLDWHGPSAADAFATVTALCDILRTGFVDWVYPRDTKLVVMGHSNGGQGAWYVASRWPDKVKAGMFDRLYLRLYQVDGENSRSRCGVHQVAGICTMDNVAV